MQNKGMKVAAATLAAIIIAGGFSVDAKAAGIIGDMPGAGISVVLNESILATEETKETKEKRNYNFLVTKGTTSMYKRNRKSKKS